MAVAGALVLGALLVALPGAAFGGAARAASNSKIFTDSVGEDPNAPDITSIHVSNTDAGLITFQVNISNRPTFTPDMLLLMFLDTDANASTGDAQDLGAEYAIQVEPDAVSVFKWTGNDYGFARTPSLGFDYASTGASLRISAADIGGTKALKFGTIVFSGVVFNPDGSADFKNAKSDQAPDSGHSPYAYSVLTKLALKVVGFTTSPKVARAGKPFSVGLAAEENDTAGPVDGGSVTCSATVAGRRLTTKGRAVDNGVATCAWVLPKNTKGATVRGSITLAVRGKRVSRLFAAKIR